MTATRGRKAGRSSAKNQYILANQILDLVRDRRMDRGERLAEIALAEHLGVSRTPVRAALKLLLQEGVVLARPNQGFSLRMGWVDLRNTTLALPTSSDDDLYMRLIRERLAGRIPNNTTQAALIEHFDVNRAMLIKTLGRLADEGLVVKNKGHGWTFMPAIDTAVALRNSYDFRLTVEPAVFRLQSFEVDMVALNRVRSRHMWLLEQSDALTASGQDLFEIDAQFHETIASFGGNSFLLQAVQHQNRLRRMLEYQGYWNLRRIQSWVREHLEIIDAIWANDMETAEARMRLHLENAYRAAMKLSSPPRVDKKTGPARPAKTPEPARKPAARAALRPRPATPRRKPTD